MSLTDIITTAVILLVIAAMIIPAIINLIIVIKCFDLVIQYKFLGGNCWGMKECGDNTCRLKRFCPMHQNAITPEVITEVDNLLEERHKELVMEDKHLKHPQ